MILALPAIRRPDWLPYVLPMAVFLAMTSLEAYLPKVEQGTDPKLYALAYGIKVIVVTLAMIACRTAWSDLLPRPSALSLAISVLAGLTVAALWVKIPSPPIPFLTGDAARVGFDPGTLAPPLRYVFLAFRFFGLVIMVPIFEELFWRSFLMRWVIDQDFKKLAVGTVTPLAALITSGLFALAHPEWLPALITGLIWAGLLWKTRSISACVISHMVANLGLGIYVMATESWVYW